METGSLATWNALSSEGIIGAVIDLLGPMGDWAGAASDLISLIP